jgi:hypothetical protein
MAKFSLFSFRITLILVFGIAYSELSAQNFYKKNQPKTTSVQIGFGVGTFYAAPRPQINRLIGQVKPVLTLGVGKRIGSHITLNSMLSLQNYGNKMYVFSESGKVSLMQLYQGISYAFELTPTFNLMPAQHHSNRAKLDFNLGLGLGYLATYRAENFIFQDQEYTFNFLERSVYIPVRPSVSFKMDAWSDLAFETVFFYTRLQKTSSIKNFDKYGNHFSQVNLVYRRFIK